MASSDPELARLAAALGAALAARQASVATAESCTGGWIAKSLTDVPGSSVWFGAGFVTYSNAAKTALLGVPETVITRHGAVSEPVVDAMARGCRERAGADYAVAVSGIAGPDGGTADKPVGTVWLAVAAPGGIAATRHWFAGDREAVRRQTVGAALETVLALVTAGD